MYKEVKMKKRFVILLAMAFCVSAFGIGGGGKAMAQTKKTGGVELKVAGVRVIVSLLAIS
jgi:hypothetical protein